MSISYRRYQSAISFLTVVLLAAFAAPGFADTTPSESQLQNLYMQRVVSDNHASEQFFGKMGTTQFHYLKKVACEPVSGIQTTQACKVKVEITSVGLGRHQVKDRIVLKRSSANKWRLISGVFN